VSRSSSSWPPPLWLPSAVDSTGLRTARVKAWEERLSPWHVMRRSRNVTFVDRGELSCAVCAVQFTGRADALYCSAACRQKAYRLRTLRSQIPRPGVATLVQRASAAKRVSRNLRQDAVRSRQRLDAAVRQLATTRRELFAAVPDQQSSHD
jgi:hypothetical protein